MGEVNEFIQKRGWGGERYTQCPAKCEIPETQGGRGWGELRGQQIPPPLARGNRDPETGRGWFGGARGFLVCAPALRRGLPPPTPSDLPPQLSP